MFNGEQVNDHIEQDDHADNQLISLHNRIFMYFNFYCELFVVVAIFDL